MSPSSSSSGEWTPVVRMELKRADAAELVAADATLSASPFVTALGVAAESVLRSGTALRFSAKAPLFQQGQPGHSVFFVLRGEVRLVSRAAADGDENLDVGRVLPGQFLGEAEVLDGGAMRAFSAYAVGDAEVVELPRVTLTSAQGVLAPQVRILFEQSRAARQAAFDEMAAFFNRW